MSDTFTAAFEMMWDSLPAARAVVYVDGTALDAHALAAGIERTPDYTDQGVVNEADSRLRMLAADEPTDGMQIGRKIEVAMVSDPDTRHQVRIAGRWHAGGVIRYALEADNA